MLMHISVFIDVLQSLGPKSHEILALHFDSDVTITQFFFSDELQLSVLIFDISNYGKYVV